MSLYNCKKRLKFRVVIQVKSVRFLWGASWIPCYKHPSKTLSYIAMNFPLSTAFIVSHRFWVVVFSFSLVSMHILISFFISSVICWLFRRRHNYWYRFWCASLTMGPQVSFLKTAPWAPIPDLSLWGKKKELSVEMVKDVWGCMVIGRRAQISLHFLDNWRLEGNEDASESE